MLLAHFGYFSFLFSWQKNITNKLKLIQLKLWPFLILITAVLSGQTLAYAMHGNTLEILQNRHVQVVLSASTRAPMMKDLGWDRSNCRWEQHLLLQTFKCLKQITPVQIQLILLIQNAVVSKKLSWSNLDNNFWQNNFSLKFVFYREQVKLSLTLHGNLDSL